MKESYEEDNKLILSANIIREHVKSSALESSLGLSIEPLSTTIKHLHEQRDDKILVKDK